MVCLVLPLSILASPSCGISLENRLNTSHSVGTPEALNFLNIKFFTKSCLFLKPSPGSFAALTLSPNISIFLFPLIFSPMREAQAGEGRHSCVAAASENSGPLSPVSVSSQADVCFPLSGQLQQGLASWSWYSSSPLLSSLHLCVSS